jgi:hypothetical protein
MKKIAAIVGALMTFSGSAMAAMPTCDEPKVQIKLLQQQFQMIDDITSTAPAFELFRKALSPHLENAGHREIDNTANLRVCETDVKFQMLPNSDLKPDEIPPAQVLSATVGIHKFVLVYTVIAGEGDAYYITIRGCTSNSGGELKEC